MFSLKEYEEKIVELEALPLGAEIEDLNNLKWTKNFDGVWYSTDPVKRNSIAMIALLNPIEDSENKTTKSSKRKSTDSSISLFD